MINGNDRAFPVIGHTDGPDQAGLTKFEYFVAIAMQGLLSADTQYNYSAKEIASLAYEQAYALIANMNGEDTDNASTTI